MAPYLTDKGQHRVLFQDIIITYKYYTQQWGVWQLLLDYGELPIIMTVLHEVLLLINTIHSSGAISPIKPLTYKRAPALF